MQRGTCILDDIYGAVLRHPPKSACPAALRHSDDLLVLANSPALWGFEVGGWALDRETRPSDPGKHGSKRLCPVRRVRFDLSGGRVLSIALLRYGGLVASSVTRPRCAGPQNDDSSL